MCDCSPGYVKVSTLDLPGLRPPQAGENSYCYAVYCSAYYAAVAAFWVTINANLDPACDECVEANAATQALIDVNIQIAKIEIDYNHCRKQNG